MWGWEGDGMEEDTLEVMSQLVWLFLDDLLNMLDQSSMSFLFYLVVSVDLVHYFTNAVVQQNNCHDLRGILKLQ